MLIQILTPNDRDILLMLIGAILSGFVTIFLIIIFRPCLCILKAEFVNVCNRHTLKVTVRNASRCFAAVNLRIEVAFVNNNKTYHLQLDRNDFLILSKFKMCGNTSDHERTFQSYQLEEFVAEVYDVHRPLNEIADVYGHPNTTLRVRVHAYHELTGFGRAFESKFRFINGAFTKI